MVPQSPAFTSALLDACGIAAALVDSDGQVRHLTAEARRALGLSATDQPGTAALSSRATERGLQRSSEPLPGGWSLERYLDVAAAQEVLRVALHDLRSPIANVRSYAGLLTRGKLTEEKIARMAEVVARNADRALRLTAEFIESELAELAPLGLNCAPAQVDELVRAAIASRRPLAQERDVRIELGNLEPLTAPVDSDRLVHAVEAVLDRAVARAPEGTAVKVEQEPVRDRWVLALIDGGGELPSEERTFRRKAQIVRDHRLSPAVSLSLARAVLRAHGGELEPSSGPYGTRWRFILPRPH